jgi:hypothetical protein
MPRTGSVSDKRSRNPASRRGIAGSSLTLLALTVRDIESSPGLQRRSSASATLSIERNPLVGRAEHPSLTEMARQDWSGSPRRASPEPRHLLVSDLALCRRRQSSCSRAVNRGAWGCAQISAHLLALGGALLAVSSRSGVLLRRNAKWRTAFCLDEQPILAVHRDDCDFRPRYCFSWESPFVGKVRNLEHALH